MRLFCLNVQLSWLFLMQQRNLIEMTTDLRRSQTLSNNSNLVAGERLPNLCKCLYVYVYFSTLYCSKLQSQFQSMEVRNSHFAAYIDAFTTNTYIMVIMSDQTVQSAATLINIALARKHFERFIQQNGDTANIY